MNPYTIAGAAVLSIGLIGLSIMGVKHAYSSIYDSGYQAGELAEKARIQELILKKQDENLALQAQLTVKATEFGTLSAQFAALEAQAPQQVTKYVRQDPVFAASKRPADLHALRVRELEGLRAAAAQH